jgi:hypothetical protein
MGMAKISSGIEDIDLQLVVFDAFLGVGRIPYHNQQVVFL